MRAQPSVPGCKPAWRPSAALLPRALRSGPCPCRGSLCPPVLAAGAWPFPQPWLGPPGPAEEGPESAVQEPRSHPPAVPAAASALSQDAAEGVRPCPAGPRPLGLAARQLDARSLAPGPAPLLHGQARLSRAAGPCPALGLAEPLQLQHRGQLQPGRLLPASPAPECSAPNAPPRPAHALGPVPGLGPAPLLPQFPCGGGV